ncbi:GL13713 [Drosophila persimilis]|uniref:GL13713 n=1 Tax=Drosophila persimilis TaxID=7234 RepID=B4GNW3_DROPE|nr:GL13713 [Drosophila persimilis]
MKPGAMTISTKATNGESRGDETAGRQEEPPVQQPTASINTDSWDQGQGQDQAMDRDRDRDRDFPHKTMGKLRQLQLQHQPERNKRQQEASAY